MHKKYTKCTVCDLRHNASLFSQLWTQITCCFTAPTIYIVIVPYRVCAQETLQITAVHAQQASCVHVV